MYNYRMHKFRSRQRLRLATRHPLLNRKPPEKNGLQSSDALYNSAGDNHANLINIRYVADLHPAFRDRTAYGSVFYRQFRRKKAHELYFPRNFVYFASVLYEHIIPKYKQTQP